MFLLPVISTKITNINNKIDKLLIIAYASIDRVRQTDQTARSAPVSNRMIINECTVTAEST